MNHWHRTAAVLSIGDELTLGQTLDTNSKWVSDRLVSLGVVVVEHATVPDDRVAIASALRRLARAADVVVVTGGLGPTADDLTRVGLSDAMGDELIEDAEALATITEYFRARGSVMRDMNRGQALRPRRGACLPNPHGTAPGLFGVVEAGPRVVEVICLPGPPREMKPMFEAEVLPRIRREPDRVVIARAIHTFGLGESEIATRLGNWMDRERSPTVGTTASQGVVTCRIRYEGASAGAAAGVAEAERAIRSAVGAYAFGVDGESLASVVLDQLRQRREMVATVESCTGGMLGAMLTDIPGSSEVYAGGWVTYTNELKSALVGVPRELLEPGGPGAVSRETAEAMACGGLDRSGADHCLAITGIAGPGGGSETKPVGTVWIARASRGALAGEAGTPGHRVEARQLRFTGERATVRDWAVRSTLAMLRFWLIGERSARLMREVADKP